MSRTMIPQGYQSTLSLYETQEAIALIKKIFQGNLSHALHLKRVSAPLFVDGASGLNDDTPWTKSRDSPGQNTAVGSLSLFQGIFPTQGLNPGFPHCRRILTS